MRRLCGAIAFASDEFREDGAYLGVFMAHTLVQGRYGFTKREEKEGCIEALAGYAVAYGQPVLQKALLEALRDVPHPAKAALAHPLIEMSTRSHLEDALLALAIERSRTRAIAMHAFAMHELLQLIKVVGLQSKRCQNTRNVLVGPLLRHQHLAHHAVKSVA